MTDRLTETAPAVSRVTALTLADFRNYRALSMAVDEPLVVLTGANGAGKTNLLEALSLLAPGRGLRRASYADMVRRGATDGWVVSAAIATDGQGAGDTIRIGTGTQAPGDGGGRSRQVRIDGARASAEAMQAYLRLLWLTPAMDRLFTGPPGDRRRFLDRLVLAVDPAHGRRMTGFDRLVSSRNRLLDEGRDTAWLDALERDLAESAVAVSRARATTVQRLADRIAEQDDSGFPRAGLALEGDFELEYGSFDDFSAAGQYREALAATRRRDRAAGRTLSGPHRSDLSVTFAEKAMPAALSSTGEQKALLVGLVLAQAGLVSARTGQVPILLLDEIAAHLDAGRRANLFERLAMRGGQAFMTGTDPTLFAAIASDCQRFDVADGTVSAAQEGSETP